MGKSIECWNQEGLQKVMVLVVKTLPPMQETQGTRVQTLGGEDPLEEAMPTHSSILAWRIPWTAWWAP